MAGYNQFFPYPEYKPLQINVMDFVSGVVGKGGIGLVEAYCGFGKTIATFAPALAQGKRVLLLTPNYTARNAAIAEALRINKEKGKGLKIADLRAKQVMCRKFPKQLFSHEACHNAKKYEKDCRYYSNAFPNGNGRLSSKARETLRVLNRDASQTPARFFADGLISKEPLYFQLFQEACDAKKLCAYELMKKQVEEADVVILDYYWVFTGIFPILRSLLNPEEFVLLVDEADMLLDRLYNHFNTQLSILALNKFVKQCRKMRKKGVVEKTDLVFLEDFTRYTASFLQKARPEKPLSPQSVIDFYVKRFQKDLDRAGVEGKMRLQRIIDNLADIVEAVKGSEEAERTPARPDLFLAKLAEISSSPNYLSFVSADRNKVVVKPFEIGSITLSNARTLAETLREFHSAVLFSATLGDESLFLQEIGLEKGEARVYKTESMPHRSLLILIDTELDTTYRNRHRNAAGYAEKILTLQKIDPSLLVSCCNQDETSRLIQRVPSLQDAGEHHTLKEDGCYAVNIRSKHARSTNKAKGVRNCIVVGLPLPDYSDFYFQQRKWFLEKKYGKRKAGKIVNRKAVDTAVQLTGRITRNLSSPKAIVLADRRYRNDFFLGDYYYNALPSYLKPFAKTVNSTPELKRELKRFWKGARQPL